MISLVTSHFECLLYMHDFEKEKILKRSEKKKKSVSILSSKVSKDKANNLSLENELLVLQHIHDLLCL